MRARDLRPRRGREALGELRRCPRGGEAARGARKGVEEVGDVGLVHLCGRKLRCRVGAQPNLNAAITGQGKRGQKTKRRTRDALRVLSRAVDEQRGHVARSTRRES